MKWRVYKNGFCFRWLFLYSLLFLSSLRGILLIIEFSHRDKINQITHFDVSSQIFDRNGELLFEYYDEVRRIPVEKDKIPQNLINATLMAEDERFFEHVGVDPLGIIRAAFRNVVNKAVLEGGSTLGQQLVKNTVLGASEGYGDKLQEVLFSIAIDIKFSKSDILHLYLNTIPYGSNVYGVEAASRFFFNKHVDQISLSEASILAALPKHPTYLLENHDELKERRDYLLQKLYDKEYITESEYSTALSDPVKFVEPEQQILAPHFVMHVKEQIEAVFGKKALKTQGFEIYTTLDLEVQKLAETTIKNNFNHIHRYNADNAGMVVLDPKTGDILAMVGNANYFDLEEAGNVNITTSLRQPGSAFKPFAYATLLETQSLNPATIFYDVPTNFAKPGEDPYIPKNYQNTYRGPVTMRDALAMSLNIPAVKALDLAGLEVVISKVEEMGLTTFRERERFGLSLVLGGGEVKLVQIAGAYATFANNGVFLPPQTVMNLKTFDGREFPWRTQYADRVFHPETAYQITSILSDNRARTPVFGSRSPLAFKDVQVAAKTGTTQEYRDAWTIGYTSNVVVGVWVGNHDNEPMYYGSAGSIVAGPIWRHFMDEYLERYGYESFVKPDSLEEVLVATPFGARKELIAPWQRYRPIVILREPEVVVP